MAEAEELLVVTVKNGAQSVSVSLPADARVQDLQEQLRSLTNVHPRGQKLIFKGKVLDSRQTLKDVGIVNGSKLMMIASDGVHQGAKTTAKINHPVKQQRTVPSPTTTKASGSQALEKIGILSLQGRGLVEVPESVWNQSDSVRILDLSANALREFPSKVLTNAKKLNLASNNSPDAGINWKLLCCFKQLTVLVLDNNCFTYLPPEIQQLSGLKHLHACNNKLERLPDEIGALRSLETLRLASNRLTTLPFAIGQCTSLIEIDVSANYLREVPPSIGDLKDLKILDLDNNALKAIPGTILKGCTTLDTLTFHGNELTVEEFREVEGWEEYDERRKAKCTKKLALGSIFGGFDEGGDTSRVYKQW